MKKGIKKKELNMDCDKAEEACKAYYEGMIVKKRWWRRKENKEFIMWVLGFIIGFCLAGVLFY